MPLPAHISEQKVIEAIDPSKDVDGFHPVNVGRMVLGLPAFVSATPAGVMDLITRYKIPTAGKSCVVVGRSNNVGKPMGMLLSLKGYPGDATVTLCHSRTVDLPGVIRKADIIIAALGKAEFITADMVKEGAVVIDVGITRVPSAAYKIGMEADRGCEVRRGIPEMQFHHTRTRRCRAHDDSFPFEKYTEGSRFTVTFQANMRLPVLYIAFVGPLCYLRDVKKIPMNNDCPGPPRPPFLFPTAKGSSGLKELTCCGTVRLKPARFFRLTA